MNYIMTILLLFIPGNENQVDIRKQLTTQFLIYIESNKIDSAVMLMDQHKIKDRKNLFSQLQSAHKDIVSFRRKTFVSIMLIGSPGDQFYRCRYFLHTPNTAAQYRIDVYFDDKMRGRISDVKLFDSAYMAEDHMKNLQLKDAPPSSPPPVIKRN